MWIEQLENGKFKYFERYKDTAGRTKKVSVTLDKDTDRAKNSAQRLLYERIAEKLQAREIKDAKFWDIEKEWREIAEMTSKPATIRAYNSSEKHLREYIQKNTMLSEVSQNVVHQILEELYYRKNFAFSTITIDKALLSNVFKYAIGKGYPITNPTEKVKLKKKQESISDREAKRQKYLEQIELSEVINNAKKLKNSRWADIIEFLSLTGLREGELFGLRVKNIQGDKIIIDGTFDRATHTKVTPKNKYSERSVRLPKRAIEILQNIMTENIEERRVKGRPNDFIFVSKNGMPIINSQFNKVLKTLSQKKNLTSHIFRHTHIAILTELGVPLKAIMERVGHNNPQTTLAIYSHVTEKISQGVIDKLDTLEF